MGQPSIQEPEVPNAPSGRLTYAQLRDLIIPAFKAEYLADVRRNMIGFDAKAYYREPVEKVAA